MILIKVLLMKRLKKRKVKRIRKMRRKRTKKKRKRKKRKKRIVMMKSWRGYMEEMIIGRGRLNLLLKRRKYRKNQSIERNSRKERKQ